MSSIETRPTPSNRQLLIATAVALAVGSLLLVTTVLPAEYGIDPTGLGARMGIFAMSKDAEEPLGASVVPATASENAPTSVPSESTTVVRSETPYRHDTMSLTLAPGEGSEIKASMRTGDAFVFQWQASGGDLAVDMHGERVDAAKDEYTSYWIEPVQREASGSFTAPFEGSHGWYWLNRGTTPVTVALEVSGFQTKLYKP